MKILRYLGALLLVMASLFGLGALSATLEGSEPSEALVDQAALTFTSFRPSPRAQEFIADYTCHGKVLASYDLKRDKLLHLEEVSSENPYRIKLNGVLEFAQVATGWEANQWARATWLEETTEGLSKARQIGLFLGAATGFLAGRWYVLGKALSCKQEAILKHFQSKEFWQHVIRLKLRLRYDESVFDVEDGKPYYIMQHVDDIRQCVAACRPVTSYPQQELAFWSGLKNYRSTLDDAATSIGIADAVQLRNLEDSSGLVATQQLLYHCLLGKNTRLTYMVLNKHVELNSFGAFSRAINIGCLTFFYLFLAVAAFFALRFIWVHTQFFRNWWTAS
jgi:hypothetical protein